MKPCAFAGLRVQKQALPRPVLGAADASQRSARTAQPCRGFPYGRGIDMNDKRFYFAIRIKKFGDGVDSGEFWC